MKPFDSSLPQKWVAIVGELGYLGKMKTEIYGAYDTKFGSDQWSIGHLIGGDICSKDKTIELYEDAYFHFLHSRRDVLEWLIESAHDVYDINPSNVLSGVDYSIQECVATHLQDIAVRRVVKRLGREFKGNRLIQIRGYDSEGYVLNPGKVPFHQPELIVDTLPGAWWDRGSIEDFYQTTKVILVNPDFLLVAPDIQGPDGQVFYRNTKKNYYQITSNPMLLRKCDGRLARRLVHEDKTYSSLPWVALQPYSDYLEIKNRL